MFHFTTKPCQLRKKSVTTLFDFRVEEFGVNFLVVITTLLHIPFDLRARGND